MQADLISQNGRSCLSRKFLLVAGLATALAFVASPAGAEAPYDLAWTRQLGTSAYDVSFGVAADAAGNVFISGTTRGSLGGQPNAGYGDAFVAKYDASGKLLWTRQLGTSGDDDSCGVAADAAGNVFISGETSGNLGGQPNAGGYDAFVAKYDASGKLLWTRQLGTSARDVSFGVAADADGNVFISGETSGSLGGPKAGNADAFVAKYDASGNLLWTRQLGTFAGDVSYGVAADAAGNVFISGFTWGSLGGQPNAGVDDVFVAKLKAP